MLSKKAALSLWQAHDDKELVRRFLGGYSKSGSRRYGAAVLGALSPKMRSHGHLDDVHDATDALQHAFTELHAAAEDSAQAVSTASSAE